MRALLVFMGTFFSATAWAGSTTGIGAPVAPEVTDTFTPEFLVGVESGVQFLAGSNGNAFAPGFWLRGVADVRDFNLYRVQASYTFATAGLASPSKLFEDDAYSGSMTGSSTMHTVVMDAKVLLLAHENRSAKRFVDPWISSGGGFVMTVGTLKFSSLDLNVSTVRWHPLIEAAIGIDFRPIDRLSIGVLGRVQAHPAIRTNPNDGKTNPEILLGFQPGLTANAHF